MGGTLLNVITVIAGALIGLSIGHRFSDKVQQSVVTGLGFVTLVIGIDNALKTGNIIIPLLSLIIGVIIGEALNIEAKLETFAAWIQSRFSPNPASTPTSPINDEALNNRNRFVAGFVTATLVFCIGPLTFMGSIQDGMSLPSGFQFLAIKSTLDFFAAIAFAASFGIGVLFSGVSVLLIQGSLALVGFLLVGSLGASITGDIATSPLILEMTAVGGLILIGLALMLMDIKKARIANFLPALIIAPLIVFIADLLSISIYPL
ncbi:DUF554 domain-containing protein [Anaerolineales bacterium]